MLYIGRKRLKYDSLNAGHEFDNSFKMNGLCVPQQKLHSCFNSLIRTRKRKKNKNKTTSKCMCSISVVAIHLLKSGELLRDADPGDL